MTLENQVIPELNEGSVICKCTDRAEAKSEVQEETAKQAGAARPAGT